MAMPPPPPSSDPDSGDLRSWPSTPRDDDDDLADVVTTGGVADAAATTTGVTATGGGQLLPVGPVPLPRALNTTTASRAGTAGVGLRVAATPTTRENAPLPSLQAASAASVTSLLWPLGPSFGRKSLMGLVTLVLLVFLADSEQIDGQTVEIWMDSLRSSYTWDPILLQPFTRPCKVVSRTRSPTLDESLSGSRLVQLPAPVHFNENVSFSKLCEVVMTPSDVITIRQLIDHRYCVSRVLVAGQTAWAPKHVTDEFGCPDGFPLGHINRTADPERIIINNHLSFHTFYTTANTDTSRGRSLVGVKVVPLSVDLDHHTDHLPCSKGQSDCQPLYLDFKRTSYAFSMSVDFIDVTGDVDLSQYKGRTTDSSFFLWLVPLLTPVVLFIATIRVPNSVLLPLLFMPSRTIQAPSSIIRQMREDMTCTPSLARLLTAMVACGTHLAVVVCALILLNLIGIVEEPVWPVVLQTFVVLYMITAFVVGFTYARLDRAFHGKPELLPWYAAKMPHGSDISGTNGASILHEIMFTHWFSILLVGLTIFCNIVRFFSYAFSYLSAWSIMELVIIWAIVGLPLAYVGKYLGAQSRPLYTFWDRRAIVGFALVSLVLLSLGYFWYFVLIAVPVIFLHTTIASQIVPCKERRIVVTPWHVSSLEPLSGVDKMQIAVWSLLLGLVPFGCIFLELEYLFDALLGRMMYISVARSALVFVCFASSSMLAAWLSSALAVHRKDYVSLPWRAFLVAATPGLYMFVFSVLFCLYEGGLLLTLANVVLFLSFTFILSFSVSLIAGALGFFASQLFVYRLFAAHGTIVAGDIGGGSGEERFLTLNGVRFNPSDSS